MNKIRNGFAVLALAACPLVATAALPAEKSETKWEMSGGTTFGLDITKEKSQDATKAWLAETKVGYYVAPQIQAGIDLTYYHYGTKNLSGHYLAFLVGPTFDFLPDPERSPYVFAGIGQASAGATFSSSGGYSSTTSVDQFAYSFGAGMRIRLADHVSWSPQVQYLALDEADDGAVLVRASHDWNFMVFRLSVLF